MPPKKCFVISPIGQSGSEVREHADDVFDFIIKPAMAEVGIAVYRADHDPQRAVLPTTCSSRSSTTTCASRC